MYICIHTYIYTYIHIYIYKNFTLSHLIEKFLFHGNPFMYNGEKWSNLLYKSCCVHTTRFKVCLTSFQYKTRKG